MRRSCGSSMTRRRSHIGICSHSSGAISTNAQFCDRGSQYRSAVFYLDDEQKRLADISNAEMAQRFKPRPVVTEIAPATEFYPAEDYHQDYYRKNELKYKFYRWSCGRDARLEEVWGAEARGSRAREPLDVFSPC